MEELFSNQKNPAVVTPMTPYQLLMVAILSFLMNVLNLSKNIFPAKMFELGNKQLTVKSYCNRKYPQAAHVFANMTWKM